MGAALNGMVLHGGLRPFGATFFIFSDYMRPSVRLAALMKIHPIYVWTHDSIGLGEDGPTHQPIEQLASLRAMPNMTIMRPADANETAICWRLAIEHDFDQRRGERREQASVSRTQVRHVDLHWFWRCEPAASSTWPGRGRSGA